MDQAFLKQVLEVQPFQPGMARLKLTDYLFRGGDLKVCKKIPIN
jgi:hypothetical protein